MCELLKNNIWSLALLDLVEFPNVIYHRCKREHLGALYMAKFLHSYVKNAHGQRTWGGREWEREGKKKREKHLCEGTHQSVAFLTHPSREWTCNSGMCPCLDIEPATLQFSGQSFNHWEKSSRTYYHNQSSVLKGQFNMTFFLN